MYLQLFLLLFQLLLQPHLDIFFLQYMFHLDYLLILNLDLHYILLNYYLFQEFHYYLYLVFRMLYLACFYILEL